MTRVVDTFKDEVNVVAVSTDTIFSHEVYHNYEGLLASIQYKMAGDVRGVFSEYFGAYNPENGLDFRGTYIVNPELVLVAEEKQFYNVGRSIDELIRKLHAFMHAFKNPTEVVPCEWRLGGKTLKPAEIKVGKVGESYSK